MSDERDDDPLTRRRRRTAAMGVEVIRELRPPTDSERRRFAEQFATGIPAVREPISNAEFEEALDGTPSEAERAFIRKMRLHGDDSMKLAEYVGRLAYRIHARERDDSAEVKEQIEQLREVLARPPNGAAAKLASDVTQLTQQVSTLSLNVSNLTATVADQKLVITAVGWAGSPIFRWIAAAVASLMLGSIWVGIGVLQSKSEREGAINSDLARLKEDVHELLNEQRHSPAPHAP